MAALELEAKLAILDQALDRLEGELRNDEHWRALHLPAPEPGSAGDSAAWAARNTRLRLALEANPVYRAWRDVKDATESLRGLADIVPALGGAKTEAEASPKPQPLVADVTPEDSDSPAIATAAADPSGSPAQPTQQAVDESQAPTRDPDVGADDFAAHYDLPQDIANLIRAELEAAERQDQQPDSDQEMQAVGARATRAMDKLLAIPSVEPVGPEQLEAARRNAGRLDLDGRKTGARASSLRAALQDIAPVGSTSRPPEAQTDGNTVPLEAEDLAFLLSPSTAPTKASLLKPPGAPQKPRIPLLERLKAEEQVPRPLAATAPEEAEVTLVRRGTPMAPPQDSPGSPTNAPDPEQPAGETGKALRLSQLLKAWTRS